MNKLFKNDLTRLDLLKIKDLDNLKKIRIFVCRNHSFELIESVLNPFLQFSKLNALFDYSSYDDSLGFSLDIMADLIILWVDCKRYNQMVLNDFLEEKIKEIREKTESPIICAYVGANEEFYFDVSDAYFLNVNAIVDHLGDVAFNIKREQYFATRISNKASLVIAQYLGLKLIPSILLPNLKAIIVDLDNTLYHGILGEDGINSLVPYNHLQKKLKELKDLGFLLCIVSKNNLEDVKQMFEYRSDFILKWEDFVFTEVNWNPKIDNIISITQKLNIGYDSLLFIDDNISEIELVESAKLGIRTILAESEKTTLRYLNLYPGLFRIKHNREDKLREKDLKSIEIRKKLAQTISKEEFFKKLDIKLEFSINNAMHVDRITELLNKTNQFILSYKRFNKTKILEMLRSNQYCIITASMKDKLSDSGIIAIFIGSFNDVLFVEELTISCRALGRNIEDILVSQMISLALDYFKQTAKNVQFFYKKGARNNPALEWLKQYANVKISDCGIVDFILPNNLNDYGIQMELV